MPRGQASPPNASTTPSRRETKRGRLCASRRRSRPRFRPETVMTAKIAVAFVHGIEVDDPEYAATATKLLKKCFARHVSSRTLNVDEAMAIRPVYWSPVLNTSE